eukprot:jgi/Orpsp1_1/1178714/evm.model.c7180000066458.1
MSNTDSMIYCSRLSLFESSSRGSSPCSTPLSSPCASPASSFLQCPINHNDAPKSPIDIIAKKRGASYQKLTISTSSIKKKSIYLRSPKVGSSEFSKSPYTESTIDSPCLNSSLTPYSPYCQSPEVSKKSVKKPFYMMPIFKPILVTNNNYVSSSPSYFKILYSHSKIHHNEFSFIPVNDKYEHVKNFKENSYSCHGIKFSRSKSVLTNNKGTTIFNIKKR